MKTHNESDWKPSPEQTAHHEAGHAVANVVLKRKIVSLSINVTKNGDEEETCGSCESAPNPGDIEDVIVTCLAAQFAEAFAGKVHKAGVDGDECDARCFAKDVLKQRKILKTELTDDQIDENSPSERRRLRNERHDIRDSNSREIFEFLNRLRIESSELIQKHELAVKDVAAKLLAAKTTSETDSAPSKFIDFVGEKAQKMVEESISATAQIANEN